MQVFEIFKSISGEVGLFPQGTTAVFIRMSGCNLRCKCKYCDAKEAQDPANGRKMSVQDVFHKINGYNCKNIVVTGGEPFQQTEELINLISLLKQAEYLITIETNGTRNPFPHAFFKSNQISIVMDYKIWEVERPGFLYWIKNLRRWDFIKFVFGTDSRELEMCIDLHKQLEPLTYAKFAYSPILPINTPGQTIPEEKRQQIQDLLQKIGGTEAVINLQIHKFLGLE